MNWGIPGSRSRKLLALAFWCAASPAFGWIYPEHRDIAVLAVQGLDAERRAVFDRLWQEARAGGGSASARWARRLRGAHLSGLVQLADHLSLVPVARRLEGVKERHGEQETHVHGEIHEERVQPPQPNRRRRGFFWDWRSTYHQWQLRSDCDGFGRHSGCHLGCHVHLPD